MIAILLGLAALVSQSQPLPSDFVAGVVASQPVESATFAGLAWDCGDELCFAGLDRLTVELVTGP